MLGKQAKTISPRTLEHMLTYANKTRQPQRDAVVVLLSVKAGLRACEIAGLEWSMIMTDKGQIGDIIDIRSGIAKRGSGRRRQCAIGVLVERVDEQHLIRQLGARSE
jgi:integrase